MFELVPESRFGEDNILAHPVWARFYDPDEIDDIVGWGIDRETLLQELKRKHDGSDHAMYPVLQTNPLPEDLDLYIRADFVAPDRRQLTGYLHGIVPHVVTVFWAKDKYSFSAMGVLSDLNAAELARIRAAMRDPSAVLFPIAYHTSFRTATGQSIAGIFEAQCSR